MSSPSSQESCKLYFNEINEPYLKRLVQTISRLRPDAAQSYTAKIKFAQAARTYELTHYYNVQ